MRTCIFGSIAIYSILESNYCFQQSMQNLWKHSYELEMCIPVG
jgi:hypothetical protein